jgi:hypothetical protein
MMRRLTGTGAGSSYPSSSQLSSVSIQRLRTHYPPADGAIVGRHDLLEQAGVALLQGHYPHH